MKKIKKMREALIFVLAGAMVIFTVSFVFYLIGFLLPRLNKALNVEMTPPSATQFDIDGFEKLNLIREN